jgi:hypothetical protein
MPDPPTLAEIKEYGVDVFCWCNRCSHNGVVEIDVLIAHCGPLLSFPSIHGLMRCQACGSKDIAARPNWRGLGVVAKHQTSPQAGTTKASCQRLNVAKERN